MRFNLKQILSVAVAVCAPLSFIGCGGGYDTPDISPHLIASPSAAPVRPIDEAEGVALSATSGAQLTTEQYRARVDELYSVVVYDGKRPIFEDDDPVAEIYASARAILDKYVLNEWHADPNGEYEIVHVIHDWLVCNIDYDFELYDMYWQGDSDLMNDPAFYMDGVFLGKKAVCDGLSRAFDFLCAIEGISSIRVTGSYGAGPHAWNKVRLGGEWFNVDVTADSAYYMGAGGRYDKQLSHGYFLVSDKTLGAFSPNGHVFEAQPYIAERDYDYYATSGDKLVIGGKEYSRVIESAEELNELFKAVSAAKGEIGKLEVMLDFDGKAQVNAADMYATEIRAAYDKVKNAEFKIDGNSLPYFRYPNGVYLFLIYR
ncbi:MAG: hypothetical protein HDT28_04530 [Clostridiales bacterium]|nr:hypothetical protein [Clostridiales bacterium]